MRVVAKIKFYLRCNRRRRLSSFCRLKPILAFENELYFYCHENKYLLPVSISQVIVDVDVHGHARGTLAAQAYGLPPVTDYQNPKELVLMSEEQCIVHTKNEWFKLKMCDLFTLAYKLNKPISMETKFLEKYGIKITKELLIRSLA